jgi:hypothetical protein
MRRSRALSCDSKFSPELNHRETKPSLVFIFAVSATHVPRKIFRGGVFGVGVSKNEIPPDSWSPPPSWYARPLHQLCLSRLQNASNELWRFDDRLLIQCPGFRPFLLPATINHETCAWAVLAPFTIPLHKQQFAPHIRRFFTISLGDKASHAGRKAATQIDRQRIVKF